MNIMSIEASPILTKPVFQNSSETTVTTAPGDASVIQSQENPQRKMQPDFWLSASTSLGQVYLGILKENEGKDSLCADDIIVSVLAMQKLELTIQLVEDWLGITLDLAPTNAPNNQQLQIEFLAKENTSTMGLLSLPLNSLSGITQPPEVISNAYSMQWKSLPLELQLSCIEISNSQLEKIEAGGLYLLTESFRPDWFCEISASSFESMNHLGKIHQANQLQVMHQTEIQDETSLTDSATSQGSNLNKISVRLESPAYAAANYLLSWSEEKNIDLEGLLFSSKIFLWHEKNKIAVGIIIPVSQGYAVMIEGLL